MQGAKPKKYRVVTLGCRTNQYESQAWRDQLAGMGYVPAGESDSADLCIVNSCTVTESADRSSRAAIRKLAREHPSARLVVTGCSVERDREAIGAIRGVSDVVPNEEKEQLLSFLYPELKVPEFSIQNFDAHTRAFVKVQDGCNSFCTYCVIPYVRGRSRSRTVGEIVQEVEALVANGYKEVVLTGINVGDFDGQGGETLAALVRRVDAVEGIQRIRVSSIDPDEIDEDLSDAILNGKHTCHSMHMVLQSGSNVILKKMNRKYTRQIFLETAKKLQNASEKFTFTTDVIVGFPGETEVDFQETLQVLEEVKFAKVHLFPYSPRPRTRAALYPNQVAPQTKNRRKRTLLSCAEKISFSLREKYVGWEMTLLTEQSQSLEHTGGCGHTENFLFVSLPNQPIPCNEIVKVRLVENTPEGLVGKVAN